MKYFFLIMMILRGVSVSAEDPTGRKPFFPWLWEDQFKPTLLKAVDENGLIIAASGLATTVTVHQFDRKISSYNEEHPLLFSEGSAERMGELGNGLLYVGIAATQTIFDQDNGLAHSRALVLASLSHWTLGGMIRRNRPGNRPGGLPYPSSCPSGHATQAFATAGSLAYSYGWKVGVPAYAFASAMAVSRVRGRRHWASDVVAGAFLGTFWARASFEAEKEKEKVALFPSPVEDGLMLTATWRF